MEFTVEDVVVDFLADGRPRGLNELAEEMKMPPQSLVTFGCILYRMYCAGQAFIDESNATISLKPPFVLGGTSGDLLKETVPLGLRGFFKN